MTACSACAAALTEDQRYCPSCGEAVSLVDTPTSTAPRPVSPGPRRPTPVDGSASQPGAVGRFGTGTVLAGRYRIVERLGGGGMGEVYRAEDLTLGQVVALKFLPEALRDDPDRRERFLGEVRIARQVSHPSVCRVYDVDEVGGQLCLSMEYVDGEDLASLLRRIGRLAEDKALEVARQLCAGLAAVHGKGVLHRDLKPENVMIDGEGKARLTDFGLAGLAQALRGPEVRSGTPAYMSPEQLAGREVTVRSDVYALGLVLFELFTGRRAFEGKTYSELERQHREQPAPSPSELVDRLDPAIERAILRCLEKDARRRPASALAVAAALPGADPLAAALAAGETPSPELVAAAGEGEEALRPGIAAALLAATLACLAAVPILSHSRQLFRIVPFEKTPAVVEDKARELLGEVGAPPALDSRTGFMVDVDYINWIRQHDLSPGRWRTLAGGEPPVIRFWYRQSPRALAAKDELGRVAFTDPPALLSGMAGVQLDMRGRLSSFYVIPPQHESEPAGPAKAPDWTALFTEAHLDPARFAPAAPQWAPPFYCDTRAAWTGSYADRPDLPIRVEAGAHRGRPVFFQIVAPWTRPERMQPYPYSRGERAAIAFGCAVGVSVIVFAGALTRRHLRHGQGDRAGASRLAVYTFTMGLLAWALVADHAFDLIEEVGLVLRGCGAVLFITALIWTLYLAVEPYFRRRWPHALISWARLLAGRVRDAVIGRDLLIGVAGGAVFAVLNTLAQLLPEWTGGPGFVPRWAGIDLLLRPRDVGAHLLFSQLNAAALGMIMLLLILVFRLLLRRQWAAVLALLLLLTVPDSLQLGIPLWIALPVELALVAVPVFVLVRFGLLSAIVTIFVAQRLQNFPLTDDFADWTAGPTQFLLLLCAGLAVYGFRQSLGGRRVFRGLLAGE